MAVAGGADHRAEGLGFRGRAAGVLHGLGLRLTRSFGMCELQGFQAPYMSRAVHEAEAPASEATPGWCPRWRLKEP